MVRRTSLFPWRPALRAVKQQMGILGSVPGTKQLSAPLEFPSVSVGQTPAPSVPEDTRIRPPEHCRDSHHPVAPSLQSTPVSFWRTHLHGDKILLGMARARIILPEMQCYLGLG